MKILVPVTIDASNVSDSNIPPLSDGYPEWSATATYNTDDIVAVLESGGYVNKLFRYLGVEPSTGDSPLDVTSPPLWQDLGSINTYRSFDNVIGSQSRGSYPIDWQNYYVPNADYSPSPEIDDVQGISYEITTPRSADTISIFNIGASYVNVLIKWEGVVVYENRVVLSSPPEEATWFSYFYSPLEKSDRAIISDLPIYPNSQILIAVAGGSGGDSAIGEVVIGPTRKFGATRFGTTLSSINFSRKERDVFGNFIIVERGFADEIELDVSLPNNEIPVLNRTLKELRATPTVWIGGECYPDTIVYGYLRDYGIVISGPYKSDVRVSVEGLI